MPSYTKAAVGVFILGGLLLFAVGLFWIGDRRQLFTESMELYTEFANVSALARGAKVRVAGMDAGEILEIRTPPDPDARFRIRFRVISDFKPILRTDSVATIQTDGIVGATFLQVEAGTSAAEVLTEGATIPSREPVEISDLLEGASATLRLANRAILEVTEGIEETVEAILNINRESVEVIRRVGEEVEQFAAVGNRVIKDVSGVVADVRAGQGSIGRLVTDDSLYETLRKTIEEGEETVRNFREVSDDLQTISSDLKDRELGDQVERVAANVETMTQEVIEALRSLQDPDGASGGLLTDVRQTIAGANAAMTNLAENTEALKRNFLFRGFFNRRGFFDLDSVSVREYREGRFLRDRRKIQVWIEAGDLFDSGPDGSERLTDEGKARLDFAMAGFLAYSRNDPLIVESWAGRGSEPERVLQSRERAIAVSDYLLEQFALRPNYVGIMPMNAAAPDDGQFRDGVALVLFASRDARR
jgi:phospholipid/cholesterol/gamma-HCH transport system substrate-binding protein